MKKLFFVVLFLLTSKSKSNNYQIDDGLNITYSGCEYNHVYKYLDTNGNLDKIQCLACHTVEMHTHVVSKKTFKCKICGKEINTTKIGVIESIPQYNYFD